ncbi:MAG: aminopeptidase P family N-terminal domain-containing protein [Pseudomonadota bacterium]
MFEARIQTRRDRLAAAGIDVAPITDDDNVSYLTGYDDDPHMALGRPTALAVPRDGDSMLITPHPDLNAARASAAVDRIAAWDDGIGDGWRAALPGLLAAVGRIDIEPEHVPPVQRAYPFRCGRATGFSVLETPPLVIGDTAVLQPGLVFFTDASVTVETLRAHVGDSVVATETEWAPLSDHPKALQDRVL